MAIETSVLHRRDLFSAAAGVALGGLIGFGPRKSFAGGRAERASAEARLVSAARIGDVDGGVLWHTGEFSDFALPGRAHGIVRCPQNDLVMMVARRPGTFAAILNPAHPSGETRLIAPVAEHRFGGHAAVDGTGRIVTGELHEETAEGVVVLRDGETGAARGLWPLGGIEPHDLVFAQGGARLVVALGGIAHAASVKGPALNAGKIESALVELDSRSGRVLARHTLPIGMGSLSMRHMALAPDGETIAFGMQDQDRSELRPLVGVLHLGRGVELFPLPEGEDIGAFRFYIGSIAVDSAGRYVAATSPKGGVVGLWSLSDGRFIGGVKLADVCGLTADTQAASFWATSGLGDIVRLDASEDGFAVASHWRAPSCRPLRHFDNHLLRI